MRRDAFLRAGAGGMLVAAVAPFDARAAALPAMQHTLTAAPYSFSPDGSTTYPTLAYNGSLPGPVLRAMRGQEVRVRFQNRAGEPGTVHWHGFILPNAMDGAAGVTQPAVPAGGDFLYHFHAEPSGTRWYHDHAGLGDVRGLFGAFVVDEPNEERADAEFVIVLHDVADMQSFMAAMKGRSDAPMIDPMGSQEMNAMRAGDRMDDEVRYLAHCINGHSYPSGPVLNVRVGDRVRLRVLNANQTQTRYLRLAGHRLTVTHTDGNRLAQSVSVDALRLGVAERLDAWFEVTKPGAWLLQTVLSDPLAYQQAVLVATPGMQNASPLGVAQTLDGVDTFSYLGTGGRATTLAPFAANRTAHFVLDKDPHIAGRWTMNGKSWPDVPPILVRHGDRVSISFENRSDMEHPMHLHGHRFNLVSTNGIPFARPLPKDTALVAPWTGTMTWNFIADAFPGRWLLHCHNAVHMMGGMMTEVRYIA
ncbi:MAG TPA: multicopper oxidase family protein [Candidatus Dormibacteraeota bacterium]|nr:multicopper oxidase family protein [Candidatus Dormibacteraeota bacterium]